MSTWAVIAAGGTGERLGRPGGKQLVPAAGRPILALTLEAFDTSPSIDGIVLVCDRGRGSEYAAACDAPSVLGKVATVVDGGQTRQASVASGIAAVPDDADVIVIHDGARPLVTPGLIEAALETLAADPRSDGGVVGHPVFDTLKIVGDDGIIVGTRDRGALWVAQTPQVFRAERIRAAFAAAERDGYVGTDDASLVERIGGRVVLVNGPRSNIKVTVPEDVVIVDAIARSRVATREGQ